MTADKTISSRRELVIKAGRLASAVSLTTLINPVAAFAGGEPSPSPADAGDWDLSWVKTLATATDRAVFDWPSLGDPADPQVVYFAERYLNNCQAAYAPGKYDARAVLNIRTQAVPAALNDATWERFALGKEYNIKDPMTQKEAVRNPFWHRAPDPAHGGAICPDPTGAQTLAVPANIGDSAVMARTMPALAADVAKRSPESADLQYRIWARAKVLAGVITAFLTLHSTIRTFALDGATT